VVGTGKVLELGARSPTPAVAAGFSADAGLEGGGGAEPQKVPRGKVTVGETKKMSMRAGPRVVEKSEGSQQIAPSFEAASTAARKRTAEDSVNDKLAAMAETIGQLVTAQRRTAESQKAFPQSNKAVFDRNKPLSESNQAIMETIKAQGEEIKALKALLQESSRPGSHSEVFANSGTPMGSQTSQTRSASAGSSQVRKEKPQVQDKRAVSVEVGRFKGAKNKYNVIRDGLNDRLKVNKVTKKLTIKCLRPSPGDRIDVVFADKDKGIEAKQHTRWLTSSLAGARVNGEQWYPVNSVNVVK
jgi:hypothetical protein